ncbi:MAG: EF-P lysine aminoacylase EpmA [Pirellulales bacterium]
MPADFLPTASWDRLRLRAALLAKLRGFFDAREFLEVETPLLSADIVVDRHLDPFVTLLAPNPCQPDHGRRMYLQTSPEFGMKRLLAAPTDDAAGPPAIYQVTRSFRNGEAGRLHNPEFTIAEWYQPGASYIQAMQFASDLCDCLLTLGPADRLSYGEAFEAFVGLSPHGANPFELAAAAETHGLTPPPGLLLDDRDGWLQWLLGELVEPLLGESRPLILYDYPASQSALAIVRNDSPPVAERFEVYLRGIELINGYHELLDADELRDRHARHNVNRAADGKPPLPETSRLLSAMDSGLPACCGAALGFDRLVMLAAGAESLAEVVAFPSDRA